MKCKNNLTKKRMVANTHISYLLIFFSKNSNKVKIFINCTFFNCQPSR